MEQVIIKHVIAADINNPNWVYIPSNQTNVKERFEDAGHKFKDVMFRKVYDFTGLDYWTWQITHKEDSNEYRAATAK
jgi:hypothetical protein